MKTAIVIGATGLVGRQLVELLLQYKRFDTVKVFARRSTLIRNDKLREYIVDFDKPDEWKKDVTGDVLFSTMGTTIRAAGSKEAQYRIDYTYQFQFAKIAAANGVHTYILVSAAGSSPRSALFYSRMKGELERDIKKLPFDAIHIVRPGMLTGQRTETRLGEQIGSVVLHLLASVPGFGKYKPIAGRQVAEAMINVTFRQQQGIHTYSLGQVFALAANKTVSA